MNNLLQNKRDEFLKIKKNISLRFVPETVPVTVNENKRELSIPIIR